MSSVDDIRAVAFEALREIGRLACEALERAKDALDIRFGVRHDHRHIMRKKIRRLVARR